MKKILEKLFAHQQLPGEEARQILLNIADGQYNPSQVAAFMAVYQMRPITVEELAGFRTALLEMADPVDLAAYDPMDLCGTGGDGKDTFNISTLASFVTAGAGVKVAKHGNYSVSSSCGSSDVMQHLGYQFTREESVLQQQIEQAGICFLHAPLFHPAMKEVSPIRKELGVKTFFNMLGPMVNPARPKKQMVGVFSLELARLYQYLYQQNKLQFSILHSLDGYDEISLTGAFKCIKADRELILEPEQLGLRSHPAAALRAGRSIKESADIFVKILQYQGSQAQREVVFANAAMAIQTATEQPLPDCLAMARESLASGAALKSLKRSISISQKIKAA